MTFGDKQDWDMFAVESEKDPSYGRPDNRSIVRAQQLLAKHLDGSIAGKRVLCQRDLNGLIKRLNKIKYYER